MESSGVRLVHLLAERGHGSRSWLAGELGVSRTSLHRWMRGDAPWPDARRAQVAALLGVDEADLRFD